MSKAKVALQLLGLAAWTAAWLGAGGLILNRLFPEEKKRREKLRNRNDSS